MGVGADLSLFNFRAFGKGEVDTEGEGALRAASGTLPLHLRFPSLEGWLKSTTLVERGHRRAGSGG